MSKIGILLTNTGTPDAPTVPAVRRYLREFLSDKRIVQIPRLIWLPLLYGLILPFRSKRSTALYQKIWTTDSPMRILMQKIREQMKVTEPLLSVEIGMNYGKPSIPDALAKLLQQEVDEIIVLPLFPQYSYSTTASSFDRVKKAIRRFKKPLSLRYIEQYFNHPAYIETLAKSVKQTWESSGSANHLLISFHGIPERFVTQGDPYASQCEQTAALLAKALGLPADQWTLCYQSQFGYDKWLKPATHVLLTDLPQQGIQNIDIICPGFSVDCLETLEEIVMRGKEVFTHAGGKTLRYIPALNDSHAHIDVLLALLLR